MRTQNRPFRLTTSVAVAALLLAQTLPQPTFAQGAPPPPPQAGAPDQQTGDPPARVGRLAQINGAVSFHTPDETQWSPATRNYPVTQGDAFWTEPNAQAVIEISASRVALAPGTEMDVAALTDTAFQATVPQGEVYLRLRAATPDETYAVQTPRGLVTLTAPGRYGIVAGDTQSPTTVTVLDGSAHVEGPGVSLDVSADQAAGITGTDTFAGQVEPAQRDPFLTAMLASERPPPQQQAVAPPPAVAAMPGAEDLAQYGSWSDTSDYGEVWYPQVAPDWVPYREGSWAYVAPWGWTWVDSDPWGFAPFHYGRWAEFGGRWGWIPGGVPVPVYAPALVTFLGVGAVVGIGIGAALAAGRVGWCPLGPREAYHPWYHASDRYFRQVNIAHATNFTTINRNVTINNFANRGAATVVPTSTMTGSRPVAASFQRLDPAQMAQAHPVIGQQPLRPTTATVGVTPAVAHQLNLPPATPGLHRVAPGPAIHATPVVSTGVAAGAVATHQAVPILRNPTGEVPATTTLHPVAATPGLRAPPAPGQIGPPAIVHGPTAVAPGAVTNVPPAIIRGGTTPATITHAEPLATAPPLVQHGGASVTPPITHAAPLTTAPPLAAPGGTTPATITHTEPLATAPPLVQHGGASVTPPITHAAPLTTAPPLAAPGGTTPATITHAAPLTTTPLVPHSGTTTAPPVIAHTVPLTAAPPPVMHGGTTTAPAAITHVAPVTAPPPPVVSHAPVTPMVTHVAPVTPPPVVHTPPPPVVVHPAAPAVVYHPPPPPVVHTAPAVVHAAPAAAPQYHPPPPPAAHSPPPQNNQKKPGQP